MSNRIELEEQLNSFEPGERRAALEQLAAEHADAFADTGSNVNMHFHSFFSYNAEGWSPSRIAWESRKAGLYASALCDFDVLDGMNEFLDAGLILGLRTAVNLETRTYVKEYADHDMTSPGEPGVTYIMGGGFAKTLAVGSAQANELAGYRQRARSRNVKLIERINPNLSDISIDYENDVLPLTPSGSATERHIVSAYINKAVSVFEHADKVAEFWSPILEKTFEETVLMLTDTPALEEIVRAKLAKRGGIGYEQPSVDTFPPFDKFLDWVASCDAMPMATWLDGTSSGEADGRAMLECMIEKGAVTLNIIPDRNWNIADPETRAEKTAKLNEIVEIADGMDLPINVGTEMNKLGLKFVDDLDCEALKHHKNTFLKGARIIVGHSILLRYAGYSYISEKAKNSFINTKDRNNFFEAVGALPPLDTKTAKKLVDMGEEKALSWFRDKVSG